MWVCSGGCAGGGGVWGHPPQKSLKCRGSEMVFSTFTMRYFSKANSTWIRCKMTGTSTAYSMSGFVHNWSIKIPGLFQDFQGPYLQKSRTSNSQENWNNPNKPTNYVAFLLRFCKSLQLLVYFAVDFRSFFRFSFWGTPMTFWMCYLLTGFRFFSDCFFKRSRWAWCFSTCITYWRAGM